VPLITDGPPSSPLTSSFCYQSSKLQKEKYNNTFTEYWGKFGDLKKDIGAAFSGQAEAGRTLAGRR